jgi:cation transport regulator ChaB
MPFLRLDELPDQVKELPRHGQEIWLAAFNAAWDQYGGDEAKAFAVAWAAVRKKFEKKDGAWVALEHAEAKPDEPGWFEIFRAGVHTDSAGRTREWTKADLEEIASLYNPEVHEAPIVIGHPADDAPAYGWIEALRVAGDRLLAKPKQLAEDFRDWIRKGLYKKVSIALYPDLGLRHVGFLGAMPPAVKGLRPAQFGEAAAWQIEVDGGTRMAEKSEREKAKEAQEERSRRYGISIKEGGNVTKPSEWEAVADEDFLDPVNYRYPCPDAEQTRAAAHYWAREDNQAQYSQEERKIIDERLEAKKKHFKIGEFRNEGGAKMNKVKEFMEMLKQLVSSAERELSVPPPSEVEIRARMEAEFAEAKRKAEEEARAREEELRRREAALKAQAQALAEAEAKQRRDKISAFCERLLKEGKLTPAMMKTGMGLETFLFSLSDVQGTFEFGEPGEDGKRKSQTALQFMDEFLLHMPKAIEYGEVGRADSLDSGTAGERLSALTRKKMSEKKELSFGQAFVEVQKEHPELASAYAQELKSQS